MALRSNDWLQLHDLLRQPLGEEAASKLMEFLPTVGFADVATKDGVRHDLELLRSDLRREMAELRRELRAEMAELRGDLGRDMADLRIELHREIRRLTMWLVGVMAPTLVAGMGLAAAIGR